MIEILHPSGEAILQKVSHLAIGAHQDDIEIMASDGIFRCFQNQEQWFAGVTCTNGAGSERGGEFAQMSDEQMQEIRAEEQRQAAVMGEYAFIAQLGYSSSAIKSQCNAKLLEQLQEIIEKTQPQVIYTHNIADKHRTHVAVVEHVVCALKNLSYKPIQFFGCEVWRGLDWLPDEHKIVFDLSSHVEGVAKLISLFRSQNAAGKRYDLATLGRMRANATFFDAHSLDQSQAAWYAMDLMPLLDDPKLTIRQYLQSMLNLFEQQALSQLQLPVK